MKIYVNAEKTKTAVVPDGFTEATENDVTEVRQKQVNMSEIRRLKTWLNTEWRWRQERFMWENVEISRGLRTQTTETEMQLLTERKNAVDRINSLENMQRD